jgi:hypothetical protein
MEPKVSSGGEFQKGFSGLPMPRLFKKYFQHTFLILLLFILISCASPSTVPSMQEVSAAFSSIESVQPQWQLFADGIGYFHGKIASPQLEFFALKIDLFTPGLGIIISDSAYSTRVSSFVRDYDLIAGINAVPFDVITSTEGQLLQNMGIVVSGGRLISPVNSRYDALVFYRDGTAAIVSQSSIRSIENIENAVGGFHQILIDGESAQRTLNSTVRHPRSAAGVSANGKYLFLLVIDGRRAGSIGATEKETSSLLSMLGSWNAINLDGGGSSTLAMRFPDGNTRVVNTPVHRFPGQERAVAGSLGIFVKD